MLFTSICLSLQLRQSNFGSFSIGPAQFRQDMEFDAAREIIGADCVTGEDKVREWFAKVPDLKVARDSFLVSSPA